MTPNELQSKLEENDIKPELIDEILLNFNKRDALIVPSGLSLEDRIFMLKTALVQETDFRKRARMAAIIISEKID